ncbi:MAG: bifunctional DNA-binding transcriptional regulator/O6-methylguanine-DNA methyltransferase Ada [Pseudomonadota bacterium]
MSPTQSSRLSDTQRWQAVCARDANADGHFFYGVTTTGVYCRPSCAARQPKRANVVFFDTAHAAEKGGLRPCRRCRPEALDQERELIERLCRFLDEHADETVTLARLGREAAMTPTRVQRLFTKHLGVSPKAWQDARRMQRLKAELREQEDGGVLDAIFEAGFGSTSRVYERLDGHIGMTPSAYRAGGAGEEIHYATRETALGPLMMAATGRGVCFAQFGDASASLLAQLEKEFPNASLIPMPAHADAPLGEWMDALEGHLAGEGPRPDLPLDLRGTAFQLKVWRFLCSVREGDVVSYGELARAIDAPSATRAAANACGANRIAVLVPCHRVLRGDGSLGGYRWGVERKRALLDAERRRRALASPDE